MHRPTSLSASAPLSLLCSALALFALACSEGRFPVCKSDAECQDAGKGNVCFDLRCVECRYDTDCKPGWICGQAQTCSSLGGKPDTTAESAAPPAPKDSADPSDPNAASGPKLNAAGEPIGDPNPSAAGADCAKRCADEACRDRCAKKPAGKGK